MPFKGFLVVVGYNCVNWRITRIVHAASYFENCFVLRPSGEVIVMLLEPVENSISCLTVDWVNLICEKWPYKYKCN